MNILQKIFHLDWLKLHQINSMCFCCVFFLSTLFAECIICQQTLLPNPLGFHCGGCEQLP